MFVCFTSFLLVSHLVAISAKNWTHSDGAKMPVQLAIQFNARCVIWIQPEVASARLLSQKNLILREMAKVTNGWHPVVGWTTFQQILENEVHKRRKGRDDCAKPLYVISDYKGLRMDLEMLSKSIFFSNSLWVIMMNSIVDWEYFSNMRIYVNSEFYFLTNDPKTGYATFSEVYAIGEDQRMKIVDLGYWNNKSGLILNGPSYDIRRRNFRQQVLRIASIENWPITSFEYNHFSEGRIMDGYFLRLWYDLEELMNFTSIYLKSPEGASGIETESGEFNGLLGLSQRKEVDIILSELTMTPNRFKVIEFVQPLIKTRYQIYFRFSGFVIEWSSIFRPFGIDVWIAIIISILVSTFLLYWINRAMNIYKWDENYQLRFFESFFLILQTYCSQGTFIVPQRNAFRICLVFSYLTAAVILPSYSAALISALTKKTEVKPFDSMEGLLKTKTPLVVWSNTGDYELFSKAETPLYKALFPLVNSAPDMKNLQNNLQMIECICKRSSLAALLGVETGMQAALKVLQQRGDRCRIGQFSRGVFPAYQTLGFIRNSPYRFIINTNLLSFRERGLMNRYHRQYLPQWVNKVNERIFEVSIAEVATVFTLLLGGIILSSFILFIEFFSFRRSTRKRPKKIFVLVYRD